MLTCIYHPIDPFRVVEHEEAERLKESGVWFDCPKKAKAYREKVELDVKAEDNEESKKLRGRPRGINNER